MTAMPAASCQANDEGTAFIIPPTPAEIFEKRSARLCSLAPRHPVGEYLEAIAQLTKAQSAALRVFPSKNGMNGLPAPFVSAAAHPYLGVWQKALEIIISEMQQCPLPKESREALLRLKTAAPAALESSARALLCGVYDAIDLAGSPFLAAALQVYWADLASRIRPEAVKRVSHLCPVCGSPPVAGVILGDRKLRYLCCSLCATRWYVPRLTCTNCGSTADLAYFNVDGDSGARAESCQRCNTYLKLFYLETNPDAEACADDLATLTLDLLMAEKAFSRSGINLLLLSAAVRYEDECCPS
jgi:FdhE protein